LTPSPPIYVLDANIFIEAHRRYYAFDICPGFWDCLTHHAKQRQILSIDRVRAEITNGDLLAKWIKASPANLFRSSADSSVVQEFRTMMTWVQTNSQFTLAAKAEFASVADGWIAAYAKAHGAVLVTEEVFNANITKKVPLPNVCRHFNVAYTDTFGMLRGLGAQFEWSPPL